MSVVLSLSFTPWQQSQGCLSPLCPRVSPNAPRESQPVPDPAPRLDVALSQVPVPHLGNMMVAAPCPGPVPSVPHGRGEVVVLLLASWLCVPAVCACVSPPCPHPSPWGSGAIEQCQGHPCTTTALPPSRDPHSPPDPPQPLLQLPAHESARRWRPRQEPAHLMAPACPHPAFGEQSSIPPALPTKPPLQHTPHTQGLTDPPSLLCFTGLTRSGSAKPKVRGCQSGGWQGGTR